MCFLFPFRNSLLNSLREFSRISELKETWGSSKSNLLNNAGVPSTRVIFPPWILPVTLPHQAVHSVVEQLWPLERSSLDGVEASLLVTSVPGPDQVCPLREHWKDESLALCYVFFFTGCLTPLMKSFSEGLIRHTIRFITSTETQGVVIK